MEKIASLEPQIVTLKEIEQVDPPILLDSKDKFKDDLAKYTSVECDKRPWIVIDNGSYNFRAGWSFQDMPYINYRSQVAKPRAFSKEFSENVYLVGDEWNLFDAGRIQKRSAFDKNVVYHINSQEAIFDYIFSHLGVTDSSVNYPVLLTEAFWNPNYSRAMVTELLFECYQIPYLTLGVDFLFSFYYNQVLRYKDSWAPLSGLVVSSSHHVTHVVPIMDGRVHVSNSKRIGIGGRHHHELLNKSLNIKYQVHKNKITPSVVTQIQHEHTACATNYADQLRYFEKEYEIEAIRVKEQEKIKRQIVLDGHNAVTKNQDTKQIISPTTKVYRNAIDYSNSLLEGENLLPDRIIQLDWSPEEQPTEEELKRKETIRKEQGQRLKEINLK